MSSKKQLNIDDLKLGVCYYPEHWDKSLWEDDMKRMKEVGIHTIRIAEFAWSIFEKQEGVFSFDFFDDFMKVAEKENMNVIFGTPTATPPVWLTTKYEEALNADIEGNLYRHGCRRHYNYNSKKYNELCDIIVEKLAIHYGNHPNIVGWQIDNELNCELMEFYSESDTIAFRNYVKEKYGTLEKLNEAWGTVFWNQTYIDWEEVHLPRKVVHSSTNQHQVLDYIRFVSDSACRFANRQSEILRKHIRKDMFITTNGMFGNLDNHKLTEESLDFYTYDSYPNFAFAMEADPLKSTDLNDRKWSKNLAEVRSISNIFGIMEQQSSANGWSSRIEAPAPKPEQLTLWTMQSVAHGADFVSYFRWRTCTKGTEIYWHGILDYSNRDNRRLAEVKRVFEKFEKLKDVAGAKYKASVGILKDYDNIWDAQIDNYHMRVEKVSQAGLFEGAQVSHTPFDYVYLKDDSCIADLEGYEVLFYPHATIMTESRAELLKKYVANGGKIVFGSRTAYKDINGHCPVEKLPWLLRDLTGTDVIDYTLIGPADEESFVVCDGREIPSPVFNDVLDTLDNAKALGKFKNNYYKDSVGLIENSFGSGKAYYFGGAFNRNTTIELLSMLGVKSPYSNVLELPEECELAVREKDGVEYIFVLNYSKENKSIKVKENLLNLYNDEVVNGDKVLSPYETIVFKRK